VSIALTALDVTEVTPRALNTAEWIELFGRANALESYAAGTVSYEVQTRVGPRAERVYVDR
jgi:alanine racemase